MKEEEGIVEEHPVEEEDDMTETTTQTILKVDPELQELLPNLSNREVDQLEESLLEEGCRDPLLVWGETIVDGHNRYALCTQHGISFETKQEEFQDKGAAKVWILKNQLGRRNLTDYQRTRAALKLKEFFEKEAKERQRVAGEQHGRGQKVRQTSGEPNHTRTDERIAATAGVSRDTVRKVEIIEEKGDEETKVKAASGEISTNAAYRRTVNQGGSELGVKGREEGVVDPMQQAARDWFARGREERLREEGEREEGEREEVSLVRIKRAGVMEYMVEWSDGTSSLLPRKVLFDKGFKKCKHCSGFGVVAPSSVDKQIVSVPLDDLDRAVSILQKHFDVDELCRRLNL